MADNRYSLRGMSACCTDHLKKESMNMGKLSGKVIGASVGAKTSDAGQVGLELRRLRLLSDLTQKQIAQRMNVQQAAISKIEKGGEVYITTIQSGPVPL